MLRQDGPPDDNHNNNAPNRVLMVRPPQADLARAFPAQQEPQDEVRNSAQATAAMNADCGADAAGTLSAERRRPQSR